MAQGTPRLAFAGSAFIVYGSRVAGSWELETAVSTVAAYGRLELASVSVYDVSGRQIRSIAHGQYGDGIERATWDGRDGNGARVASGVYFLRAATAGQMSQMKVVVVR